MRSCYGVQYISKPQIYRLSHFHYLSPILCRARAVYKHWIFFSARTHNGQLADREETFTEFDKKCIGLESLTAPLKSSSTQKCVSLIVTSPGCLSFTVQNDACAEFDTRRLFSHSSAEAGKFLCAHLKSEFNTCTCEQDFVTSHLVWSQSWCSKQLTRV